VHDQRDDDRTRVAVSIVDVLAGVTLPRAEAGHSRPRSFAARTIVSAAPSRAHVQCVAECGMADALRPRERWKRPRPFQESDGLRGGSRTFRAAIVIPATRYDLCVLLRLGACK